MLKNPLFIRRKLELYEITEDMIKRWCGKYIYERAFSIYNQCKINKIESNKRKTDIDNDEIFLSSVVQSSISEKTYDVSIHFSSKYGILKKYCSCPAFDDTYTNRYMCKHMGATLLKYANEKEHINSISINKDKVQLLQQLKNAFNHTQLDITPININFTLFLHVKGREKNYVELKIGENKLYIVRNVKDFLSILYNKTNTLVFGKNFTLNPSRHYFAPMNLKIIDLFLEIYEYEKSIDSSIFYKNEQSFFSGKKLYLSEMALKRFLSLAKYIDFNIVINDIFIENVHINEENIPMEFTLDELDNELTLQIKNSIPVPLTKDWSFFFYNGLIYELSKEQVKIYAPLLNYFITTKNSSIEFLPKENIDFFQLILPALQKAGAKINIDKTIKKKLIDSPLGIKIYLDKENDSIKLELLYSYGDYTISPFTSGDSDSTNKFLIRDIASENKTQVFLNSYRFSIKDRAYYLENEEDIIEFLEKGLATLQELGEIYYSEDFKNIKFISSPSYSAKLRLNEEDFLEFNFSLEGVDQKELKSIYESIKHEKKYFKLKSGGYISLRNNTIKQWYSMLNNLNISSSEIGNDSLLVSKYNALFLDESIEDSELYVERDISFSELVHNIKTPLKTSFVLPYELQDTLRNYQRIGFQWLKVLSFYGFGGILADEMGLGKTLQTIAFLLSESKEGKGPSLVVAPTSLVYNWSSEIKKFAPNLKHLVVSGNKEDRRNLLDTIKGYNVIITSYALLRRDIEEYKDIHFEHCILDEAQNIKNPSSINAISCKNIKSKTSFALTGTPMENNLTELWSIFDFVLPGYLLGNRRFKAKYEIPIVKQNDINTLKTLNKKIHPFILRRKKKDVVSELPPKIQYKLVIELTEEQKKIYAAYLSEAKDEIQSEIKTRGFQNSKIKILSVLTRLRQICCDPSIFIYDYKGESGKIIALLEIIEEAIDEGHRILLFSQFTSILKKINVLLNKMDIDSFYLDGSTPMKKRGDLVNDFNEGEVPIFLISLKAGGTGLNLTGADIVIHFDPWWNPAVEDQASDRAHRIGQNKTVEVIKLLAKGTIEEKINLLQEKKKEMIESILEDGNPEENFITKMTPEELSNLLSME